jgi:hypothetical protein
MDPRLTREDRVTPDVVLAQSNSTTLHQALQSSLGRRVVRLFPTAHQRTDTTDGDDTPSLAIRSWLLLRHLVCGCLSRVECSIEVDVLDFVP